MSCYVVAELADFEVGGVQVVFDDGSKVGLYKTSVLTYLFKFMSFVSEIDAILVLGENSSGAVGFGGKNVPDMGVGELVFGLVYFCFVTWVGFGGCENTVKSRCSGKGRRILFSVGWWMLDKSVGSVGILGAG